MDWKNHPFMGETLGSKAKEYKAELKSHRKGTDGARSRFYSKEDYSLEDDGFLIWDHAIWIQILQWLFKQDEEIDMESLYEYLEGTAEQIYYCNESRWRNEHWHLWIDNQIDHFINEG